MLKLQGGAQQICDKIKQKIDPKHVLTNQNVVQITRTENEVIINTNSYTLRFVYLYNF